MLIRYCPGHITTRSAPENLALSLQTHRCCKTGKRLSPPSVSGECKCHLRSRVAHLRTRDCFARRTNQKSAVVPPVAVADLSRFKESGFEDVRSREREFVAVPGWSREACCRCARRGTCSCSNFKLSGFSRLVQAAGSESLRTFGNCTLHREFQSWCLRWPSKKCTSGVERPAAVVPYTFPFCDCQMGFVAGLSKAVPVAIRHFSNSQSCF